MRIMMMLSRRELLVVSLAATFSQLVNSKVAPDNIILGGGQYKDSAGGEMRYVLSTIDLNAMSRQLSPMNFLAHGIHANPSQKNLLAIFEKKGPHACEYDLLSKQVVRKIPRVKGRYFYGHGAYSLNGQALFSTETKLHSMNGVIGIRSANDYSYLGEFPSYGLEPHECKLIDSGSTLVVTNGGGNMGGALPCVTYIDVKTQQLKERIELTRAELNTGHVAISSQGDLVVVSAPRAGLPNGAVGGVSIKPKGQALVSIDNPEAVTGIMRGEALSVAIHEAKGIAAVTHPDGGMVTFWSIASRRLLKVINLPHPRGVELTVEQDYFVVSYGQNTYLAKISVDTLEPLPSSASFSSFITGSHIYNLSRNMNEYLYQG